MPLGWDIAKKGGNIIDAGCGMGYNSKSNRLYTKKLEKNNIKPRNVNIFDVI